MSPSFMVSSSFSSYLQRKAGRGKREMSMLMGREGLRGGRKRKHALEEGGRKKSTHTHTHTHTESE
jgi:hypothetical protein